MAPPSPASSVEYLALPVIHESTPQLYTSQAKGPYDPVACSDTPARTLPSPLNTVTTDGYSAISRDETPRGSFEQPSTEHLDAPDSRPVSLKTSSGGGKESKLTIACRTRHQRIPYIWWLETGCCLLAIGGLVGMIIVIYALDGKPIPQWPSRLSINTFVAALSVLTKTSGGLVLAQGISHIKWTTLRQPQSLHRFELHDEASRGPWGAISLLSSDLGHSIASLGAFVTILVLFLEPFSQQLVSYVDCEQVLVGGTASVSRTSYFDFEPSPDYTYIPWDFRKSVYEGLYATNKPQVRFECETGNCTFPELYSSLAFCSRCQDVTSKLVATPWPNRTDEYTEYPNMTLPGYLSDHAAKWHSESVPNLTLSLFAGIPYLYEHRRILIMKGLPTIDVIRSLGYSSRKYAAYSCEMLPCVKTYSTRIHKTEIREVVEREEIFQSYNASIADISCFNATFREAFKDMGYEIKAGQKWVLDMDDLKFELRRSIPTECVYLMFDYPSAMPEIYRLFRTLFEDDLTERRLGAGITNGNNRIITEGSEPLHAVLKSGSGNGTFDDFDSLIKSIADAATFYIRQNGGVNHSEPAHGVALYNTVCVRIRWPWIAYPGAVVGLTLLFFVWVMVGGRSDQLRLHKAWKGHDVPNPFHDFKSSVLAVLFHGLDDRSLQILADAGGSNQQKELAELSKDIKVQMVATTQGWKLSTAQT